LILSLRTITADAGGGCDAEGDTIESRLLFDTAVVGAPDVLERIPTGGA